MNNIFSGSLFKLDQLSGFTALAIGLFFILTLVYSIKFMNPVRNIKASSNLPIVFNGAKGKGQLAQYYIYIILTAISSLAVVFSNNLILLLVFWGFLALTLYLLINMGDEDSPLVAKKTLIIVGGSDALMLLGIGIIYYFAGTLEIDKIRLDLNNGLLVLAYICIVMGCFAKAGAMPLHTWVADCAKTAPVPVTAYLPASLDKLLGIYLLFRVSLNLFVMNKAMGIFLMLIGAFTIIAAVMMALIQHNLKRLLGYHAVSQVGYMILGIGTGNPIGIAGGLFHMLNNAIYKSCLFYSAGNVEYRAKTSQLDELGGLAKLMPMTYISCLIASLSISGMPPFNGFVSKWLIYQGLVLCITDAGSKMQLLISAFCLIAAMLGSAFTLASFMKLLHAVFLGQRSISLKEREISEAPKSMWIPSIILAALCLIFGIFAFAIPLKYFIFPVVSTYGYINSSSLLGIWSPTLATLLIILGLVIGLIIFKSSKLRLSLRQDCAFMGSETRDQKEADVVTGIEFYNTIKEMGFLRIIYKKAEAGVFDLYEQGKNFVFGIGRFFQYLHNGVLPTYLVWTLLGMIGLFVAFRK